MNAIRSIKIQYVKGKKELELIFDDFHANHANLLVAPNGFGKSTIVTAFNSLKPKKLELKKEDLYNKDAENKASLKLIFIGDIAGGYTADSSKNEISANIFVYVINSPVYAKSTSRRMGGYYSSSAVLDVENLVLIPKIPERVYINYSISDIKRSYGTIGKCFCNLSNIFKNTENLKLIADNTELLKNGTKQVRAQQCIQAFVSNVDTKGTTKEIKSKITNEKIAQFKSNHTLSSIFGVIEQMVQLPFKINEVDVALSTIQLIEIAKTQNNEFKKAFKYKNYCDQKHKIDEILEMYNTTGRTIKSKETKGKLVVEFLAANTMSNGERDVLSFIANLAKFDLSFNKQIGLLIIDEMFDYLDGCNMLVVQYHLSHFIERYNKQGKILFPMIFTHLDPNLFRNHYFKRPKIHYLKKYALCNSTDDMMILLKIRDTLNKEDSFKNKIEKFYLHYHPSACDFSDSEKKQFADESFHGSHTFYKSIFNEVHKYLSDSVRYDPLKVICAIRIKIEHILYEHIESNANKDEFIDTHTTIKKLQYAEKKGYNAPEAFYLLQPLYNDALHMSKKDHHINSNKISSVCMKLDNYIVKQLVIEIFDL